MEEIKAESVFNDDDSVVPGVAGDIILVCIDPVILPE